jgi:hypothetical protein
VKIYKLSQFAKMEKGIFVLTSQAQRLLTVETEVNGDSKSTNERGPSLVGSFRWARRAGRRNFILHWLLWSARYKIFFPHRTLFQFMCPHRPTTLAGGSRAGSPVSECVFPLTSIQVGMLQF